MTTTLDTQIAAAHPQDEVTRAALSLMDNLDKTYRPHVEEAQAMLMDISLDPIGMGLHEFNRQIAEIRNRTNEVARWLGFAIEEKRRAQQRRDFARTAYEERLQLVLATDPEVLEVSGQQAKMALARIRLDREVRIRAFADQIYTLVLGYYEALNLIFKALADTKRDLMSQYAVIKQQIEIGEVAAGDFPVGRPGVGPPVSSTAQLEAEIAADIGDAGVVTI